MADTEKGMTKREFLEMTCLILKEILNPQMLRTALEAAATKLEIPDAPSMVAGMLGLKAAKKEKHDGKGEASAKKEKAKRSLTPYNVWVTWFSDFSVSYGHHPAIVAVKKENPMLKALGMPPFFYKTLSAAQKDAFRNAVLPYCEAPPGVETFTTQDIIKRYETEHPETPLAKLVGLEAKPEYKTDREQMRMEAAEARRLASGAAEATPLPGAAKTAGPSTVPEAQDEEMEEAGGKPAAEPQPGTTAKPAKEEKQKEKKRKKEAAEGDGAPSEKKKKKKQEDGQEEQKEKEEKAEKKEKEKDKDKKKEKKDKEKSEKKSEKKEKKEKKDK